MRIEQISYAQGEIQPEQIATLSSSQMAGRDKIEQKKANMEAKIFQDKVFERERVCVCRYVQKYMYIFICKCVYMCM